MSALAQNVTPDPVEQIENYFARRASKRGATLPPQPARPAEPVSAQLQAALDYAARGWLVIPLHTPTARGCSCGKADCASVGKHPRCKNGLKDATTNPAAIRQWWKQWPDANIGIATGPESNLLVLDVDGKQGEDSLIKLAREGCTLPDSYVVKTGSGSHLYFRYPSGRDVRNSASKLAPGLDIRGAGGYVVAPPSLHRNGTQYEPLESSVPPVDVPEWLLTFIREAAAPQDRQSTSAPCVVGSGGLIPRGKGDPAKLALAGSMFRSHQPFDVILAAVVALDKKCEHQRGEDECRRKVNEWAQRYSKGQPLSEEKCASIEPDLICLDQIEGKDPHWLWKLYLAFGLLAMLSGDPGSGKTFICLAICAGYTVGRTPDGERCEPIRVLYGSIENTPEIIRLRFDRLGGDPSRFFLLNGTIFTADGEQQRGSISLTDIPILEKAIIKTKARLLVVDPIQSYMGASVDLHRSNETRPVLDGLSKLAAKYDCAILLVRHLSKAGNSKAITRGLGSIDLSGAVRSEMLAGSLPDDPETRALIHVKSNIGKIGETLGYRIDNDGQFSWTGKSQVTAFDLLAAPEGPDRGAVERAQEWLTALLKTGSKDYRTILELAVGEGFKEKTLRRAKTQLRIQSRKASFGGGWIWWLPENEPGSEAANNAQTR